MALITTIAVGFDGSPDSERALCWAADLAGPIGADVVVIHAIGLLEHAALPGAIPELEKTARALTKKRGVNPVCVHWHPIDGDPCSALLGAASPPLAADLVVVGSRGQGSHSGLLLGSTSHELAEHSAIPVVIVPTGGGLGRNVAPHQ